MALGTHSGADFTGLDNSQFVLLAAVAPFIPLHSVDALEVFKEFLAMCPGFSLVVAGQAFSHQRSDGVREHPAYLRYFEVTHVCLFEQFSAESRELCYLRGVKRKR